MRILLAVVLALGTLATSSCRPRLMQLLDRPSTTAPDIMEDIRQAHSGGRRITAMRFMSEEEFHPGVGELFYPELAPRFVARSSFNFTTGNAWQKAIRPGGTVLWALSDDTHTTQRNGEDYSPPLGVDRGIHLRVLQWLLRPWDVAQWRRVDLRRMADLNGRPRIQVQTLDGRGERYVLEADPATGLLSAVEYNVPELPLRVPVRVELSDYRLVGGVMVPHLLTEHVPALSGSGVHFHTMRLWDVEIDVESAYPAPIQPRFPSATPSHTAN